MPEAPEVQTVLSTLETQIEQARIVKAELFHDKLADNMDARQFEAALANQCIERFFRLGKYLGFETQDYDWIVHLRMEGKFYLFDAYPNPKDKHIHAIFTLSDGRYLCYHDTRKFGRMYLYPKTGSIASLPCFRARRRRFSGRDRTTFVRKDAGVPARHQKRFARPVGHRRDRQHLRRRDFCSRPGLTRVASRGT